MVKLFEILTWVGATFAALLSFGTLSGGNPAPQQAVGLIFALSLVVIPYCVLSALQRKELMRRGGRA